MPTLQEWADYAQRIFEEHFLACEHCQGGAPVEAWCFVGRALDLDRRTLFALSTARPVRG